AGWFPFGPLRWLIVTVLVLVGAALIVARDRAVLLPPMVRWATVVLVATTAVGALMGLDGLYAWTGTPERHTGVAFWVLCAVAMTVGASSAGNRLLAPGLVLAGLALGATATAEAFGWEPAVFDLGSRLSGLMGSPAFLGAAAALFGPICLGAAIGATGQGGRALRVAASIATATCAVALAGSGARAAWVGVVVAAVVVALARRIWTRDRTTVAAAAAGLVLLAAVLATLTPVGARLVGLWDDDAPGGRGRLDEWRVATAVVADHPLTGVGPEGYRIAFAEGVDEGYEARHGRDPLPDRAHSGPLDVALSGGVVALGAWLVVLAGVARSAWRAMRSGGAFSVGVAAGLVAHWVGQLFLFPVSSLEPIAWLLGGWLLAGEAAAASAGSTGSGWVRRVAAPVLAVSALVALVTGGLGVAADRQARVAADTASLESAESAVDLRPDVVRHHLLLARVRVANGEGLVSAIDAVDDALAVSPRDPIVRLARARYLVERAVATEVPAHAAAARADVWALLADDPLETRAWALALVVAAIEPPSG
ncbi:MAG: hypothetical protein GX643_15140, partial [Acidimicrobiales bacterium]|nr:hypothetical protein [Acidimicrobiales bacterium]